MGMVVSHNLSALQTRRFLGEANTQLSKSLEKLSSGYRINTGADGPADLIISEKMRAQVAGLDRAVRNTQEAQNVLGIAEGAMNEMSAILKKMRQLALHAANNGITSPAQVAADQAEMDSSIQTIDRIANTTKYSDQMLLNGAKSLLYSRSTSEGDAHLLDTSRTSVNEVFKREGLVQNIWFRGENGLGDAARMGEQAERAWMEAGATRASRSQIDRQNTLTEDQRFILSGNQGSREFSFGEGADLRSIADAINNVAESTGVRAQIVLGAEGFTMRTSTPNNDYDDTNGDGYGDGNPPPLNDDGALPLINEGEEIGGADQDWKTDGDILGSNRAILMNQANATANGIAHIRFKNDVMLGKHTDGHGRVFIEYELDGTEGTINFYRSGRVDGKFEEADLVASGQVDTGSLGAGYTTIAINEQNDSGLNMEISYYGNTIDTTQEPVLLVQTHDAQGDTATAGKAGLMFSNGEFNTGVRFRATDAYAGNEGNEISIEYVDPDAKDQAFRVEVHDKAIQFHLATDSDGEITTNIDTIIKSIMTPGDTNYSAEAAALIDARTEVDGSDIGGPVNDRLGVVSARTRTYLSGGLDAESGWDLGGMEDAFDRVAVSGVDLGGNTDGAGKLYVRVVNDDPGVADDTFDSIFVYKDARMRDEDLVSAYEGRHSATPPGELGEIDDGDVVYLNERNDSGLRLGMLTSATAYNGGAGPLSGAGPIEFTMTANLGIRLYSEEYGSDADIRLEAQEGKLWDYYNASRGDGMDGYVNIDASEGALVAGVSGKDATVYIDGQEIGMRGLEADVAIPNMAGHLSFRAGDVGETTIAQAGYDHGFGATAVGQMINSRNMAVNAGNVTTETLYDFKGGMQFQLGEGDGDQERTVFSLRSMTAPTLGRTTFFDDFDGDGTEERKDLTLTDILGGGFASLAVDAVKALRVIDSAISDVSAERGRIGAYTASMLQTNSNSLRVAIEKITATESFIRDANMASETTDFTRNQILTRSSTAMLTQANAQARNVLTLLG